MQIINNHDRPLGLPSGLVLRPGVATHAPDWVRDSQNDIVARWVKTGVLSVEGAAESGVPDEKAAILDALAKRGVKPDKRAGIDKLKVMLEEAEKNGAQD